MFLFVVALPRRSINLSTSCARPPTRRDKSRDKAESSALKDREITIQILFGPVLRELASIVPRQYFSHLNCEKHRRRDTFRA